MQSYTSDCFDAAHTAQTDLGNMENNFNTLRSNFSGNSQPSNPVACQIWGNTTTAKLKVRNTANGAWSTMFDIDNERALKLNRTVTAGTGLSGGGTLTSDLTISHAAHTGDVTGTAELTLADKSVGGSNLSPNGNIVFWTSGATACSTVGWTDHLKRQIFIVPAKKGFLRLFAKGVQNPGGGCFIRLRVSNKYSSGSSELTNNAWTTQVVNCGSVSLSTMTTGEAVEINPQLRSQVDAISATIRDCLVVWGTST